MSGVQRGPLAEALSTPMDGVARRCPVSSTGRGAACRARGAPDGTAAACDAMAATLLPLGTLGAVETAGTVTFGLWLPWVSPQNGQRVVVKVIHERDQLLQAIAPREFPMDHADRLPHGDFWSVAVPIAGTPAPAGSAWGTPGRYVYRYQIDDPNAGRLDWIVDPFAREFGPGKLSAFTLGYQPYAWSAAEAAWRTPSLRDLVVYELDVAELGGDLERTTQLMAYVADLGVNAIEVMPLSNVGGTVDWGYLPIGYFGVDERFGKRADFQALVDVAHQHGVAIVVDAVYGHTGADFGYFDAYTRLRYADHPFMGPFAKDYFANVAKSTDFRRALTRDYFFTVNHHWLDAYHVDGFRYDCVPNYWDGPSASGTRASSTTPMSSCAHGSRPARRTGAASTAVPARRSGSCSARSSSKDRKRCCARRTRTRPGRTAPSTRRRRWRAATGAA
jgi:maltooligosyltrehalose trehalohydrolase